MGTNEMVRKELERMCGERGIAIIPLDMIFDSSIIYIRDRCVILMPVSTSDDHIHRFLAAEFGGAC